MQILNPDNANCNNSEKSAPPYAVGFLCLIPFVGVFVGLRLLLQGIIKYKNKWLAIIGGGGIVISVLAYAGFAYAINGSSVFNTGVEEVSQKNLNQLVRNIEIYKTQHEDYPYSLEQLLENDGAASIIDPIQVSNGRMNVKYNFQRTGEKYTVFSSGLDGIPDTKNDLYPQFKLNLSNHAH